MINKVKYQSGQNLFSLSSLAIFGMFMIFLNSIRNLQTFYEKSSISIASSNILRTIFDLECIFKLPASNLRSRMHLQTFCEQSSISNASSNFLRTIFDLECIFKLSTNNLRSPLHLQTFYEQSSISIALSFEIRNLPI